MGNEGTESTKKRDPKNSQDRLSEATSEQTVSDLDENEMTSGSKSTEPSDETSIPSPDGTPDPDRSSGRADGSDTGGPM